STRDQRAGRRKRGGVRISRRPRRHAALRISRAHRARASVLPLPALQPHRGARRWADLVDPHRPRRQPGVFASRAGLRARLVSSIEDVEAKSQLEAVGGAARSAAYLPESVEVLHPDPRPRSALKARRGGPSMKGRVAHLEWLDTRAL